MIIYDIINLIRDAVKESGLDTTTASFDDIITLIKNSHLFDHISKLESKDKSISINDLKEVEDPFILTILEEYIGQKNINESINDECLYESDSNDYEITSNSEFNKLLFNSVILSKEEEKDIFVRIRPYTLRINRLNKIIDERIKAAKERYSSIYNKTYIDEQNLKREIEDIKHCEEAQEVEALRREISPYVDVLYRSNIKWIKSVASKYSAKNASEHDLIQIGAIGFLKTVELFDVTKGCRFNTYSTWWIRQNIGRELVASDRTIRIPNHILDKANKCNRLIEEYANNGVVLSITEAGKMLGLSDKEIREIFIYSQDIVSLNTPMKDSEDDGVIGDTILDQNAFVEEASENAELGRLLIEIMNDRLTPKERDVLMYRMGFIDNRIYTLEEIGAMYGVTRERIRQIEDRALAKLNKNSVKLKLSDYHY